MTLITIVSDIEHLLLLPCVKAFISHCGRDVCIMVRCAANHVLCVYLFRLQAISLVRSHSESLYLSVSQYQPRATGDLSSCCLV